MSAPMVGRATSEHFQHGRYPRPKTRQTVRPTDQRFSLLISLPDDSIVRIKGIKDGASVIHVKKRLELLSGFTPPTYALDYVDGNRVEDDCNFKLEDNVSDNAILKLSLLPPYDKVYSVISEEDNSVMEAVHLSQGGINSENVFNVLFMASYYGNTADCESLLSDYVSSISETTINGNTCLHAAAARDQVSTAMFLCENDADIHQINNSGDSPLDVALEFGSFTCERKIRLSQWERRKTKLNTKTNCTATFTPKPNGHATYHKANPDQTHITQSSETYHKPLTRHHTSESHSQQSTSTQSNNPTLSEHSTDQQREAASRQSDVQQKALRAKSALNHDMPPSATEKRKERISRAKSAPPLNSAEKNKRLCSKVEETTPATQQISQQQQQCDRFKLSRPQYLQYVKSSTGVVEEDYFADIFPEQEKVKPQRSFDDQMLRNQRIFKKMFKQSGVAHQDSDTDSEEERERAHANKKAVNRWSRKKELQKQEEMKKRAITPSYPTDKTRRECLGELLMIGDTSLGEAKVTSPNSYLTAYKTYKRGPRAKSTGPNARPANSLDPVTYEQWMDMKPEATKAREAVNNKAAQKRELSKRIDYQTWLDAANKRINKQIHQQRKEEKQKKDFEDWIQELKEEVGTYDYWKRRKEEQLQKERQIQQKKEEEKQRKAEEVQRKRELAKDIYKHWVMNKELAKIKQEEHRLQVERQRLNRIKAP